MGDEFKINYETGMPVEQSFMSNYGVPCAKCPSMMKWWASECEFRCPSCGYQCESGASGTGPLNLDPVPHDSPWQPALEEVESPFRTDEQEKLRLKHGTPAEFRRALGRALWNLEIDYDEYRKAADKYEAQWMAAGKLKTIYPDAPAAPGELRVPAENFIKLPRSHWGAYKLISVSNGADRPRGWSEWCQFLWNFDFFMGPLPLMKTWTLVIFVCVVLAVWLGKQL